MSGYSTAVVPIGKSRLRGVPISVNKVRKNKKMKLSLKQRLRNWLMSDETDHYIEQDSISVEEIRLESDSMRLQVYRASGGFVIETRKYDRKRDENIHSMHIISDDKDLGQEIGKIITIETLR